MGPLYAASREASRANAPLRLLRDLYEKMATSVVPVFYDSESGVARYSRRLLREGIDAFRNALQYSPRLPIDRILVDEWFRRLMQVHGLEAETMELVALMLNFFGSALPLKRFVVTAMNHHQRDVVRQILDESRAVAPIRILDTWSYSLLTRLVLFLPMGPWPSSQTIRSATISFMTIPAQPVVCSVLEFPWWPRVPRVFWAIW